MSSSQGDKGKNGREMPKDVKSRRTAERKGVAARGPGPEYVACADAYVPMYSYHPGRGRTIEGAEAENQYTSVEGPPEMWLSYGEAAGVLPPGQDPASFSGYAEADATRSDHHYQPQQGGVPMFLGPRYEEAGSDAYNLPDEVSQPMNNTMSPYRLHVDAMDRLLTENKNKRRKERTEQEQKERQQPRTGGEFSSRTQQTGRPTTVEPRWESRRRKKEEEEEKQKLTREWDDRAGTKPSSDTSVTDEFLSPQKQYNLPPTPDLASHQHQGLAGYTAEDTQHNAYNDPSQALYSHHFQGRHEETTNAYNQRADIRRLQARGLDTGATLEDPGEGPAGYSKAYTTYPQGSNNDTGELQQLPEDNSEVGYRDHRRRAKPAAASYGDRGVSKSDPYYNTGVPSGNSSHPGGYDSQDYTYDSDDDTTQTPSRYPEYYSQRPKTSKNNAKGKTQGTKHRHGSSKLDSRISFSKEPYRQKSSLKKTPSYYLETYPRETQPQDGYS
ncbi:hypothetical protein B0T14DRAFT_531440, partial [Immersiella caudata]